MTLQRDAPISPVVRVQLEPAPTAMVWLQPGQKHEAIAVPSVLLAPGDALVEVELATICGSDVHTTLGHRAAPAPLVLGHEQVGRIVALGDGAVTSTGRQLTLGQRVVWSLTVGCGQCALCRRGLPQKCETVKKYGHERLEPGWELSGGFASHVQVRSGTAIVPVSEDLPATVLAPVSCGTATAAAALEAAEALSPLDGAVVLVFGAGLIGLTVSAMAADRGACVIVVDPAKRRRALAARFGAALVADPGAEPGHPDSLEAALDRSGDRPLVALDASGSPPAVASAIDSVGIGGVVVLVGSVSPSAPVSLDPESIVRRLVSIRGVHNYAPRHLEAAARFIETRSASYPFDELVGATVALADLDDGLEAAAGGRAVRIGVAPGLAPVLPCSRIAHDVPARED
ncbi:alcohol dehydrogenase catalytic domain-containing protein [Agreia sp. Leaf283]|uniref:alcohol dehydrogenase catalytic domain-containing protein n=1 Tax=Agreia sp. Leaf283 TaxID=1736321 RepID=UPI0006F58EFA|nr:alcohol dehydrogenase catalytic domain-containing protein [Agreia sp. Leaf283]KQP54032.1 alcohol dehydrogenase [Agreia sp. Leaf283]